MPTARHRRRRRAPGFTFTELLVAALISLIVLLTVYLVFSSNTEQYYRQEQIVQMQEGMRFAVEYLKNDLRNAGKLAIANGTGVAGRTDPGFCGTQPGLVGVELFDNETDARDRIQPPELVPEILTAEPNSLRPDRVRLLIDSTGGIPLNTAQVLGNQVDIQPSSLQVTDAAQQLLLPTSQARFESMYRAGYYVWIKQNRGIANDLIPIAEVDFGGGSPRITLTRAPRCLDVCNGDCIVNAVQLVEYAIVDDGATDQKTDLVRRVIDARDGTTPLAGQTLTMAEYAVNLQLWGTYDSRADGAPKAVVAADDDPKDDVGNWPGTVVEANRMNVRPERLRALNLLLATRTPREDESMVLAFDRGRAPEARVADERTWFELSEATGYARVATLVAEVRTPNLYKGN